MAGAFGYGADTYQVSMEMAELSLPCPQCVADEATLIVPTAPRTGIRSGIAPVSPRFMSPVLAMSLDRAMSVPATSSHLTRKLSMAELTLETARKILDAALAKGVEKKLKPLVITILDARGCVEVTAAQDGNSLMRADRTR